MNVTKQELLSAWLDDEAGDFERRRVLDQLHEEDELGQTLSRYALIGEVMRAKNKPAVAKAGFLQGIHDRLEEEPEYHENVVQFADVDANRKDAVAARAGHTGRAAWLPYGMAAAVALAAVSSVFLLQQAPTSTETIAAAAGVAEPVSPVATNTIAAGEPAVEKVAQVALQPVRLANQLDPQTRDILKQYVAQHVRYASTTAIVPSVRAVSYSNDY